METGAAHPQIGAPTPLAGLSRHHTQISGARLEDDEQQTGDGSALRRVSVPGETFLRRANRWAHKEASGLRTACR